MKKLIGLAILAATTVAIAEWGGVMADDTCEDHHPYQVTHGHDRDGDGVGCDSNPRPPRDQVQTPSPAVTPNAQISPTPNPSRPTTAPSQAQPSSEEDEGPNGVLVGIVLLASVGGCFFFVRSRLRRGKKSN